MGIPANLSHLKQREVQTYAGPMKVLQYIVRVEIEEKGTYGWQVRFRKPWKWIPDTLKNGKLTTKTVTQSYQDAVDYLSSVYVNEFRKHKLKKPSGNKSDGLASGITYTVRKMSDTRFVGIFQVSLPHFVSGKAGSKHKTIYVGNVETITDRQIEEKYLKAKELRSKAEVKYAIDVERARKAESVGRKRMRA